MNKHWRELIEDFRSLILNFQIENGNELEEFRIKFLGTKNILKPLFAAISSIPNEDKKEYGLLLNQLKSLADEKYSQFKELSSSTENKSTEDLSLPADLTRIGSRHPITLVMDKVVSIFSKIGFQVVEDREIEDDWHNFTALNTPDDHPARDMQDTFYLKDRNDFLLRTHTSSVQTRFMTTHRPPFRILAPGRVFRNETISARSHCQFHQVEGLYVDTNVSMADLKQTLLFFAKEMFGKDVKIRLRPSFFPFTEPSAEMDIYWGLKDETDHRITKGTGWLEILGCGMVDPAVLDNCGIDSKVYSGFAFGMGIERQAMLLYKIPDIRYYFENDLRFLRQFKNA
ncbi:MAG: phenylalanine--tRNA ligase subunit alpha [Saprospiraceae bacterium]|nr:phenylalanine--tRNA ligase subunit alpha [Saprospiraceae bacterium]